MSPSIFMSHNYADKTFVRKLVEDLKKHGAKVWFDEAEIKLGDSLIEKVSEGIEYSEFLAVVLSPNSVNSNWVQIELRTALSQEISGRKVKVLPILYKDCTLPAFLSDKLYADFRHEHLYRRSLKLILDRLGIEPKLPRRKRKRIKTIINPLDIAEQKIITLPDDDFKIRCAKALYFSINHCVGNSDVNKAVPFYIEDIFGLDLLTQHQFNISLTKKNASRFLRVFTKDKAIIGFRRKRTAENYQRLFKRKPCRISGNRAFFLFSYSEILDWTCITQNIVYPTSLNYLLDASKDT